MIKATTATTLEETCITQEMDEHSFSELNENSLRVLACFLNVYSTYKTKFQANEKSNSVLD